MIPNVIRLKTPGLIIILPFIFISLFSSTTIYIILLACTTTAASSAATVTLLQSSSVILLSLFIILVFLIILFTVKRNHEDELNSVKERYEKQVCDKLFFLLSFKLFQILILIKLEMI